jgi:hypothetical protein
MKGQPKIMDIFRSRRFWILILVSALLGIALAIFFPAMSKPPM